MACAPIRGSLHCSSASGFHDSRTPLAIVPGSLLHPRLNNRRSSVPNQLVRYTNASESGQRNLTSTTYRCSPTYQPKRFRDRRLQGTRR